MGLDLMAGLWPGLVSFGLGVRYGPGGGRSGQKCGQQHTRMPMVFESFASARFPPRDLHFTQLQPDRGSVGEVG